MRIEQSYWSLVGNIFDDILAAVFVFAILIMASFHKVKKQDTLTSIFLVCEKRQPSSENMHFPWEFVNAGFVSEIMRESASFSLRTIIFIIQFPAYFFWGFRSNNLSFDGVWKQAIESILAIAHIKMNAWIIASIEMYFFAMFFAWTFIDSKILIRAHLLDEI